MKKKQTNQPNNPLTDPEKGKQPTKHHHRQSSKTQWYTSQGHDAIGFASHQGTLLTHTWSTINQKPQVRFSVTAFQPHTPMSVVSYGVVVTQVENLALGLVKLHALAHWSNLSSSHCKASLASSRSTQPLSLVNNSSDVLTTIKGLLHYWGEKSPPGKTNPNKPQFFKGAYMHFFCTITPQNSVTLS